MKKTKKKIQITNVTLGRPVDTPFFKKLCALLAEEPEDGHIPWRAEDVIQMIYDECKKRTKKHLKMKKWDNDIIPPVKMILGYHLCDIVKESGCEL